jgi:hypothetical protein
MEKTFYLQPRQVGKTTIATYEYLKDPDNTVFIVPKKNMAREICTKLKLQDCRNVMTVKEYINSCGKTWKRVILDEYLFFSDTKVLYETIYYKNPNEVLIFSTPNVTYDNFLYLTIREHKDKMSYYELLGFYVDKRYQIKKLEKSMFDDLYYNFLTDKDTTIITQPLRDLRCVKGNYINTMRNILRPEEFEKEVNGTWVSDLRFNDDGSVDNLVLKEKESNNYGKDKSFNVSFC